MYKPRPFKIADHTADLRLYVTAFSVEELFRNALKGMAFIMKPDARDGGIKRHIAVRSSNLTALLVDFLNEILYLSAVHKEIYIDARFNSLNEMSLEAELLGIAVSHFDEDIKAVTYHEADIQKNPAGYFEVTLICDI